jgi:hypothetical protein
LRNSQIVILPDPADFAWPRTSRFESDPAPNLGLQHHAWHTLWVQCELIHPEESRGLAL